MVFTRTVRLMFANSIGKGVGFVDEVVARCMDYGVFDRQIYKRYGVLTSVGVQKRYAKMTERRNLLKIDGRYLLISAPENWVIDSNNSVNVDNNGENATENTESKKKKEKENKGTTTTTACACEVGEHRQSNNLVGENSEQGGEPHIWTVREYFYKNHPAFTPFPHGKGYDALKEAEKFCAYNSKLGWKCLPDWEKAADLWVARLDDMKERK